MKTNSTTVRRALVKGKRITKAIRRKAQSSGERLSKEHVLCNYALEMMGMEYNY